MIILKILRKILPPFHPLKYKFINWYYGKQGTGICMYDITEFDVKYIKTKMFKIKKQF